MSGNQEEDLHAWENSVAGGVSGCLTRLLLQPLDVLKIRFQLQGTRLPLLANTKINPKYRTMVQAMKLIAFEEGPKALWKGHVPAQILSLAFGMVQFPVYEKCSAVVTHHLVRESQNLLVESGATFFCGGVAGISATLVAQPLDVLRTRLVAQGHPKVYNGMMDAISQMYREKGIRTFYKGTWPTLLAIFPDAGFRFGFYKVFKKIWTNTVAKLEQSSANSMENVVCGAASGLVTKLLLLPFDITKKRLQVVGFEDARAKFGPTVQYSGLVDCCIKIFWQEGPRAFYKGAVPSVYKSALSAALIFHFYEQCRATLKSIRQNA